MREEKIWNLVAKKLAGEASAKELLELEELLKENPDLHYSIQTINDLWNQEIPNSKQLGEQAITKHLGKMKSLGSDFGSFRQDFSEDIGNTHFFSKSRNLFAYISIVLVLCILGIFLWIDHLNHNVSIANNGLVQNSISQISTRNGSKTNVVLPDGSIVKLNAGSILTYSKDYGNTMREVNLTGEAFFDVMKNKEKPFIIHTKKIDIKVLGTMFNVKSYPDELTTETSLVRGSIEVTFKDRPAEKVVLKPNEKLIVTYEESSFHALARIHSLKQGNEPIVAISHLNYTKKDSTIIETAWVQNKLVFRDEPFHELALKMERWYGVTIRFIDPSQEDLRFTGSFENESIQQALDALKLSGKFSYSIKEKLVSISQ